MGEDTSPRNWWNRLLTLALPGRLMTEEIPDLLDPEAFSKALHREWSRGQRVGLPLALVVIQETVSDPSDIEQIVRAPEEGILNLFARTLHGRIRCTDLLGWQGPGKLGLILPHTTGTMAWQLVSGLYPRIQRELAGADPKEMVEVKVYAYPDD